MVVGEMQEVSLLLTSFVEPVEPVFFIEVLKVL